MRYSQAERNTYEWGGQPCCGTCCQVLYSRGTFFYFVHVVNIVILAHTLAPGVVFTFLVMLVIAVVGATMGVVSGGHVLSAKAAAVVLETEVFKTLFLTFFSTSTRQTAKH